MIKGIHLEPTNKCILKCPRCSRTTMIDKFGIEKWTNKDLNLEHLKQFLDIDLTGVELLLCGTYGDPIYYNDLFDLIAWSKQQGANVRLVTNGSRRTKEWWHKLTELLTSSDKVVFSIDGSPENFTNYRVNADWASIEIGIRVCAASSVTTRWKYIPFSFNEDTIDQTRSLSESLGIDEFVVLPSDRWEENDYLRPKDFQGRRTPGIIQWHNNKSPEIDPQCGKNDQHYISAEGYYMPCCYVHDWRFYYKTKFYKDKQDYDISKTTISQVLAQEQEFFNTLTEIKPNYCTFNCPKI